MKAEDSHRMMRITFAWVGLASTIVLVSAGNARAAIWTQKADMPTARWNLSTSVVDGKIYAIGGTTALHGSAALAAVEEYDPATDTWTKKGDMPAPTDGLSTSVVNGKIYVIGGWHGGGGPISTVEEYDRADRHLDQES